MSPNKLISVGYDFQGSQTLSVGAFAGEAARDFSITSVQEIRIGAKVPVLSKVIFSEALVTSRMRWRMD